MLLRQVLKIFHTLATCGLIGGLGAYMLMLIYAPQETPADYADLRLTIKAISDYLLLPSLAVALVTGLASMAVHHPFQEKGWAWLKAALGILMFKGVLTIVSAKAGYAASVSRKIAEGTAAPDALDTLLRLEWGTLWAVMAISIANVVLGVWRPRIMPRSKTEIAFAAAAPRDPVAASNAAPGAFEREAA
jgi:hypothetical protein